MRYDELRRMAEAAIAGKDTDPLPKQAGQGNAFAILIVELLDEREEAEAKAAGMEAELWRLEWMADDEDPRECPVCLGIHPDDEGSGHAPDCTLAAALASPAPEADRCLGHA
jgi:hypothetical protein